MAFELTGFTTQTRDGVVVQVNRTTRLDLELTVGGLQETVTVSGESPVVDVSSTVTQTNITKDLYEAIPTGRNPWVMAGLVPGVITGRLDVGGTEGMQQYNLEAFGSANSQKSFSIDGLKTNWAGGDGGSTMQYYGFEMYEEYNMQTASGTAESDVSGVYMNMVTKSGGNRFTSDNNFYFMNDALQGDNIDDDLRQRLGLGSGAQTGAAGNPIDISYDWSSTLGGPIAKDRLWFFGALRRWRLDQFQIGARNADGSQAIDDNRIENYMGKATWQAAANTRASFMFNRNLKNRFHRRDAPYLFVEDIATTLQDQPAQNYVAQVNQVVGQRGVLDLRFGRMWGVFPSRYQSGADDIAIRDTVRFTRINAAEIQSLNPNHRYQANANYSYFVPDARRHPRLQGRDAVLVGADGLRPPAQRRHPARTARRHAVPGQHRQHADRLGSQDGDVGRVPAGPLGDRPRHHQRRRAPRRRQGLPARAGEPGRHLRRRARVPRDRHLRLLAEHHAAHRHLLRRVRQRPDRHQGLLRPLLQPVRVGDRRGGQSRTRWRRQSVAWNDLDGDIRLDAGELGVVPAFQRGLFPTFDPGRRPALQRRDERRRRAPARSRTWRWASATTAASTATASG